MRNLLLMLSLVPGLAAGTLAAQTEAAPTVPIAVATAAEITPESLLESMNRERAERGLAPFRRDFRLDAAAGDRMNDMLELRYWAHESPEGTKPFSWVRLRGYQYSRAAENLAAGFDTADLLVASWMESPGHRDNVIQPEFVDVGIAVIEGSTIQRTQGRSVIVLFGRELIAPPLTRRGSTDRSSEPTPRSPR